MCGGEWWRRRRPDRLLMLVVDVVAAHDAAVYWEHHAHAVCRAACICALAALGGRAAPQESRGRCEGNVEPLAAATSCRGRAVCKFGSLIASSAAGFERFWASPFPTHIAAAEGSAMP